MKLDISKNQRGYVEIYIYSEFCRSSLVLIPVDFCGTYRRLEFYNHITDCILSIGMACIFLDLSNSKDIHTREESFAPQAPSGVL